jgi:5'-3' exonuclease
MPTGEVSGTQPVIVHLVDGTYELFRHYYAMPSARDAKGREVAAVRGVVSSVLGMINGGAQYVGVATDHVIESFRNELWPGYKTGEGIEPDLLAQFPLLEEALAALGIATWPMVEFEADDALAAAAAAAARDPRVERIVICTPDKDLAQCVRGERVVQVDRRGKKILTAAGVREKFGVDPELIPDFLALVGDAADGYPGISRIGRSTAARLLNRYGSIESFPPEELGEHRELALRFKDLATLRTDAPLFRDADDLQWRGPTPAFAAWAERLGDARLLQRSLSAPVAP